MSFGLKTFLCLLWCIGAIGKDIELATYPPCAFNPLCTCSKGIPDLGIVQCKNVPFPAIPRMINTSKVFMLHMENNELQRLEPYFFQATGLYGLSISSNPITEIPDDAFTGLERSLWELHLTNNHLADVPSRAIRHLQKLRTLDLSMNQISYVDHESWRGLEDSLEQLILAENSIAHLPMDSFSGLPFLHTLDLSGNNLREIDPNVFRDGMDKLTRVLLSNNLLTSIPYGQVSTLRSLRVLDLSHNQISTMNLAENEYSAGIRLSLDALHLEYNTFEMLQTGSFQFFDVVNQTFLDGNPLQFINDDAFRQAKIRELYIRHCHLDFISPGAFGGLENSLQILDMSGNNLSSIPEILFQQLFSLKMRNIRSLALSKLPKTDLGPEDFLDFGLELENLRISGGNLKSIKSHTFKYVRGIRRLDLSDNAIATIDTDAFLEIGHALQSLKLSHSFGSSFTSLPRDILKPLTSLRELDMSNNKLKSISDTSFHFLRNLHHLNVQDNQIEQIVKGTFQGDIHTNLETILMGYNKIKYIPQHSFVDLENVRSIILSDNQIEKIERRAFMNLHQLRVLNLRGNKLTSISDEAFQ
uniref:Putative membrane glycoprotein lig-1 n=1 Tax=Lutzomyia longipalpis TaxID=7200 RepID=A0A1B0CGW6_LUTLO